ncbi:hypothetical protein, partial [Streptomyces celluloflavus]|uniref:hypothetical protein n=1 Tax=Streptomyces celluloflavus TaxID=58344 RepID=UPI0036A5AF82
MKTSGRRQATGGVEEVGGGDELDVEAGLVTGGLTYFLTRSDSFAGREMDGSGRHPQALARGTY